MKWSLFIQSFNQHELYLHTGYRYDMTLPSISLPIEYAKDIIIQRAIKSTYVSFVICHCLTSSFGDDVLKFEDLCLTCGQI